MSPDPTNPMDQQKNNKRRNISWDRGALVAVVLIVLLVLIFPALRRPDIPGLAKVVSEPNPQIGPKDAPVTIVEFGDYACSPCRIWAEAGMRQQLLDKYGNKVRFVWADFPVVSLDSHKAAEAGRCADGQGRFWEYQDYLFNNYQGIYNAALKFYASRVGLNQVMFDRCLDNGAKEAVVNLDFRDAMYRYLDGTPTFIINNKAMIVGLAPLDRFAAVIDPILAGVH
jgi:protein-disulfide isomerase